MTTSCANKTQEHVSPSGTFKLTVTPYATKPGCWNHTKGLVYRVGDDTPIAEVRRNYSSFPFLFIEDHPLGPYLVCGEDYQGQTVIELDTGKRRDELSEGAKEGHGFCWAAYTFDRENQILTVDGCYWACPYMYQFYDFSNPMSGWPRLKIVEKKEDEKEIWIDAEKAPTFSDGLITTYETRDLDEDNMEEEDERHEVVAYRIFERDGLALVLKESWVSDDEQARRKAQEEAQAAYEVKLAKWKAEDPLYLAHRELQKDPVLSPADHASRGVCYDGWCPDFKEREPRHCQRIIEKHGTYTADLEWATETGPIKLIVCKGGKGKTSETLWFEHSVAGMEKAYAHARGLVS